MKRIRLSYEELYAEVHGSDLMVDVREHVIQMLREEPEMASKLTIEKPLDPSIMNAEFVEHNKEQLTQYVVDRINAIHGLMTDKMHIHPDVRVAEGARGMIFDYLKEIEVVHPSIIDEIDPIGYEILGLAQDLFMKRLVVH